MNCSYEINQIKSIKTKSKTQNKIKMLSNSEKLNGSHQDSLFLFTELRILFQTPNYGYVVKIINFLFELTGQK